MINTSKDSRNDIAQNSSLLNPINIQDGYSIIDGTEAGQPFFHSKQMKSPAKTSSHADILQDSQFEVNNLPTEMDESTIKPLCREFYLELMQAEKRISKGFFEQLEVTKLIEMYAKCIEYFDSVQDPIKCYFEDKISSTLSSSSILSVLISGDSSSSLGEKQGRNSPYEKASGNTQNNSSNLRKQSPEKSQKQPSPKSKMIIKHIDIPEESPLGQALRPRTLSQQKKQDRMKAQHNIGLIKLMQISEQKNQSLVEEQEKREQLSNTCRQEAISSQANEIEDRLRKRKEKNLLQQSDKLLLSIAKNCDIFDDLLRLSDSTPLQSSRSEQLDTESSSRGNQDANYRPRKLSKSLSFELGNEQGIDSNSQSDDLSQKQIHSNNSVQYEQGISDQNNEKEGTIIQIVNRENNQQFVKPEQ